MSAHPSTYQTSGLLEETGSVHRGHQSSDQPPQMLSSHLALWFFFFFLATVQEGSSFCSDPHRSADGATKELLAGGGQQRPLAPGATPAAPPAPSWTVVNANISGSTRQTPMKQRWHKQSGNRRIFTGKGQLSPRLTVRCTTK